MKNFLIILPLIIFSWSLFAQYSTHETAYRQNNYMLKSKKQQRAGVILLSAGGAASLVGTLTIIDGLRRTDRSDNGAGEVEAGIGLLVTALGVASMSASIPFFIAAHKSRKRAMSISLKAEQIPLFVKISFPGSCYPAMALHIPLGR